MRFNHKELVHYASTRFGKADKEGCLWMKEYEGLLKKKETYTQRWFLLTGNLLFYCRAEHPDSVVVGLIIIERCRVETDIGASRNSFCLSFEGSTVRYSFMANSPEDQIQWCAAMNSGSYEYLRMAFSDLRGQLMHLTGKDPLVEEHPLGGLPVRTLPAVPANAPAFEGEPVFEISLACSSLVGSLRDCVPTTLIITSCMSPPQAYWIRYAQTEVIEHNCDPQFFTTVVFYTGSVSTHTQLKFEVFDVYDRVESKMCPIGQAHCSVIELIRSPDQCRRLDILFDGAVCGYLHIKAWKSENNEINEDDLCPLPQQRLLSPTVKEEEERGDEGRREEGREEEVRGEERRGEGRREEEGREVFVVRSLGPVEMGGELVSPSPFNFSAPMDNIVIRTFHFPVTSSSDSLKVTEVMGEGRYSFSIPMQLLDMYIQDENSTLQQYAMLEGLCQDWEIARQEVMLAHSELVSQYRQTRSGLQAQLEAGVTFKKSTLKGVPDLDFVPVNLHIQQMKVKREGGQEREKVVYTCITTGCPTAYSLKYRHGGLARLELTSPVAILSSFQPAGLNKTHRAQSIINRIDTMYTAVVRESDAVCSAARGRGLASLQSLAPSLANKVHQLTGHCNVSLVHDSLRELANAMETTPAKPEPSAVALCLKVEEHVEQIEVAVDSLSHSSGDWLGELDGPLQDLLQALGNCVSSFQKALNFLILQESYHLLQERVPMGVKSYSHRHDIVFSQAVTVAVTSFVFRLLQSIPLPSFLRQLQQIGFLLHWESLLSTHGDEQGMLEDFIVAIRDINSLKFKLSLADTTQDHPTVSGSRYLVVVDVPVQKTLFRLLPSALQAGSEINICAVLFSQGINEQQSRADMFGNNSLQDDINSRGLKDITRYCTQYREHFGNASAALIKKAQRAGQLLDQLRKQVFSRGSKRVDILSLSQELCRTVDGGRVTSCKSAKDRTAMSVTLEQAQILIKDMNMDTSHFQQAMDAMRSHGTRLRNAEKNVGTPLYAFNALQVVTLPSLYRPPDGTYKKLQT